MYGQGYIPDDWQGEYCCYSVLWPVSDRWLAVLRGVLTIPAQGRFWDAGTGSITEAQAVIRETFDTNLHLEEVLMACNDPGLAAIAVALQNLADSQCCGGVGGGAGGGSGGAPGTMPPLNPMVPGNPALEDPPEGFETWEEFYHDKCATAWDIIGQLQASLLRISIINFGTISLDALGVALSIAITLSCPPATIIAIAGLLLMIVGEVICTTLLSIVNDNADDLVCALYEGNDASESSSNFHTVLGDLIDSGVSDPIENIAIKTLAGYLVNHSEVNRMYTKDLTKIWGEKDCSGCGVGGAFRQMQSSDIASYDDWNIIGEFEIGVPYELDSQFWERSPNSDCQAVVIEMEGNQITATIGQSAYAAYTTEGCGDYRLGSSVGGGNAGQSDVYCNDNVAPDGERTFGNMVFFSDLATPFTITITRSA